MVPSASILAQRGLIHPSPFIITTASHTFHQEKNPTQNNKTKPYDRTLTSKNQNKQTPKHSNIQFNYKTLNNSYNKFVRTRSLIAPMTNYLIKYATSKSMRINHNICNNARMRKRNRSRMRKKIGHAELLSNGATARYTQEPSQKKRPQIQTIKNI